MDACQVPTSHHLAPWQYRSLAAWMVAGVKCKYLGNAFAASEGQSRCFTLTDTSPLLCNILLTQPSKPHISSCLNVRPLATCIWFLAWMGEHPELPSCTNMGRIKRQKQVQNQRLITASLWRMQKTIQVHPIDRFWQPLLCLSSVGIRYDDDSSRLARTCNT